MDENKKNAGETKFTKAVTLRLSEENYEALNELGVFKNREFTALMNELVGAYVKAGSVTNAAQDNFAEIVNETMKVQLGQMQKDLQATMNALYRIACFDMRLLAQNPDNSKMIPFAKKKSWQDYTEMLMGQKFPRDLGSGFSEKTENEDFDEDEEIDESEKNEKSESLENPPLPHSRIFSRSEKRESPEMVNPGERLPDSDLASIGESDEEEDEDFHGEEEKSVPASSGDFSESENEDDGDFAEEDTPAASTENPENGKTDDPENMTEDENPENEEEEENDDSEVYDGYRDGDFCKETGKVINLHAYDTGLPSSKYHVRPEDEKRFRENPAIEKMAGNSFLTREQVKNTSWDIPRTVYSVARANFLTPRQEEKLAELKIPHKPSEPWDSVIAQIEEAEKSENHG